jgi:hypothetical protein
MRPTGVVVLRPGRPAVPDVVKPADLAVGLAERELFHEHRSLVRRLLISGEGVRVVDDQAGAAKASVLVAPPPGVRTA